MPNIIEPAPLGTRPQNVIVIGGGATGALAAFELQRAGHNVTVLEAESWGNGSSSRSAACIRAQFDTESTVKGMIYATRYYEGWQEIVCGQSPVIHQNGYLFLHDGRDKKEADIRKSVKTQRAAGLNTVEFLDRAEIDQRWPYIETTGVKFATWNPTDGFLDHSSVYNEAVAAAARLGAKVVQKAKVVAVRNNSDGLPVKVLTSQGQWFAGDIFVNATGVWAPEVSRLFRGWHLQINAIRRYLYFLPGFNSAGDGEFLHAADLPRLPMIITPRGAYCRPEGANSPGLMLGWTHHAHPTRPEFDNQDTVERGFAAGETESYGHAIRKEVCAYLPDIDNMGGLERAHTGFYEVTPNHNPFIGFDPWVPNVIHAAGFSGHGLMHAPYTARIVAELVANGADRPTVLLPAGLGEVDITAFAVDREFVHGEGMVL